MPLETVDLERVEIMAAGERVRGTGSPTSGEVYQTADLERIAAETNEVLDLVQPWATVDTHPIGHQKVGHNDDQKFLKASGLYSDDRPATGWLHNLRVEDGKLVSDIRDVPRQFADLIKAKAFRRRSPEIYEHTSTVDGKKRTVVGALAWLGARRPAFQTLGDVVALYADGGVDEDTLTLVDVPEVAPTPAPSDTAGRMSDQDTKLREFAEATGLDADASSDQILEAVRKLVADKSAAEAIADEATGKVTEFAERVSALEQDAKSGKEAAEELRAMRRDRLFAEAVNDKRLAPAQVEKLKERYDKGPEYAEMVTEHVEGLEPRLDLTTSYGADVEPTEAERQTADGLALFPDPTAKAS